MLEAAFTGFSALPPPSTTSSRPRTWRDVFGTGVTTRAELNQARDDALKECT